MLPVACVAATVRKRSSRRSIACGTEATAYTIAVMPTAGSAVPTSAEARSRPAAAPPAGRAIAMPIPAAMASHQMEESSRCVRSRRCTTDVPTAISASRSKNAAVAPTIAPTPNAAGISSLVRTAVVTKWMPPEPYVATVVQRVPVRRTRRRWPGCMRRDDSAGRRRDNRQAILQNHLLQHQFMALAKGATLGPYEVLAHLGSGGMGEVWRARDRRIGRDVAVKVLPGAYPPGDERPLRFQQQARAAGSLSHPGLVTIFDVGTVGGAPYIVMELLEGETLRDVLGDREPVALPPRRAIEYAIHIASALSAAHAKGIIHRDLKPENIFVTSDKRLKILDFGLAKLAPDSTEGDGRNKTSRRLTSAGVVVGTPAYMSPEQVRAAPVNHRTDIFSLGSVLYEMISGRLAFERDSGIETMHAVSAEEPPPFEKPEISPALEAAIRHCLEKSQIGRASCRERV